MVHRLPIHHMPHPDVRLCYPSGAAASAHVMRHLLHYLPLRPLHYIHTSVSTLCYAGPASGLAAPAVRVVCPCDAWPAPTPALHPAMGTAPAVRAGWTFPAGGRRLFCTPCCARHGPARAQRGPGTCTHHVSPIPPLWPTPSTLQHTVQATQCTTLAP